MISRRSGKRTPRPTRITLTAVNFSPTSIKKQVTDVSLTLPLAHMSTLHEIIHENVREGELFEKLDRNWVRCFACGHCCKIPEGQPVFARFVTTGVDPCLCPGAMSAESNATR